MKNDFTERAADVEKQFDELSKRKSDIEDEMKRLQGEHRLLISLAKEVENVDATPKGRIRKVEKTDAED